MALAFCFFGLYLLLVGKEWILRTKSEKIGIIATFFIAIFSFCYGRYQYVELQDYYKSVSKTIQVESVEYSLAEKSVIVNEEYKLDVSDNDFKIEKGMFITVSKRRNSGAPFVFSYVEK